MKRLTRLLAPLRRLSGPSRVACVTVARLPDVVDAILELPVALRELDRTLAGMTVLLDRVERNTAGVQQLAEVVVPLRGAALRVGRLTERRPRA